MTPNPSKELTESLTQESLILKLRSTEHDFVERKPAKQRGEWLQVAVAFANSVPIGWPAVLFVGVDDEGKPQQGAEKLEELGKSVTDVLNQAYPAIYRHLVPLHVADGACLAVVIPGSAERPHFAGKAYIREGPSTKEASASQFDRLIAERTSLVYELRRRIGQPALCRVFKKGYSSSDVPLLGTIFDCTEHYVGFEVDGPDRKLCFPLSRVLISLDYEHNYIILEVS